MRDGVPGSLEGTVPCWAGLLRQSLCLAMRRTPALAPVAAPPQREPSWPPRASHHQHHRVLTARYTLASFAVPPTSPPRVTGQVRPRPGVGRVLLCVYARTRRGAVRHMVLAMLAQPASGAPLHLIVENRGGPFFFVAGQQRGGTDIAARRSGLPNGVVAATPCAAPGAVFS